MSFVGQNVAEVRNMASQLNAKAGDIEGVISQLTSLVSSVEWRGPDAERFKSDWNSQHVPRLRQVVSALQVASTDATRNADQQDDASR